MARFTSVFFSRVMHTVFCSCGEAYQVTDQHIGRRIKCGRCGNAFQVTGPPSARSGPDPRRSQQQAPPRDPYRQEPPRPRDPYREAPRRDSSRGGPPPRDAYRDDYHRGGEPEYFDDARTAPDAFKMPDIGGFLPPKIRLYLFIALAGLMLAAAGILLSTMKPVGNTLPQVMP